MSDLSLRPAPGRPAGIRRVLRLWYLATHPWIPAIDACRNVFDFWQRGRRGWSDRDSDALDIYLAGWVPAALRSSVRRGYGIPMRWVIRALGHRPEGLRDYRDFPLSPATDALAVAMHHQALEDIAVAFETYMQMGYSAETAEEWATCQALLRRGVEQAVACFGDWEGA